MPKSPDRKPSSLKKVDMLVTGVILGGVVASIYGIHKKDKGTSEDSTTTPSVPRRGILLRVLFGERDSDGRVETRGLVGSIFRIGTIFKRK